MKKSILNLKRYSKTICTALSLLLCLVSFNTHAFTQSQRGEETILIDQSPLGFSYSSAVKSFSKHILKFDIDTLLSGGQNCKDAVIRNFSDLSDRTKYRLSLKDDRVEAKFTLNF